MKEILFVIAAFLACLNPLFSQETSISGKVISGENNTSLPYVNIGIPNKSLGTVSRENGYFSIKLPKEIIEKDTLVFSYIGFESKKIALANLKSTSKLEITLQPAENLLQEVVLENKKFKKKRLGRTTKGLGLMHYNFYTAKEKEVDDRLSKELGRNFKIRRGCRFEKFNFAISTNQFKSLKFRINIYKIEDDLPGSLIISDNIIFELKDEISGWQSIDLDPYNVYVDKEIKEVLISIQWVESEKETKDSKFFAIPASTSPLHKIYYREKAMDEWKVQTGSLSMFVDAKCSS